MRALSVATKGWIRSQGIEVATRGIISLLGVVVPPVVLSCRLIEAYLEDKLRVVGYLENGN